MAIAASAIAMAIAFRLAFGWAAASLVASSVCFCALLLAESWLEVGDVDPLFLGIGLPIAFLFATAMSIIVFYVSRPKPELR